MARTPLAKTLKRIMNLATLAQKKHLSTDQFLELRDKARLSRREALIRGMEIAALAPLAGLTIQQAMAAGVIRKLPKRGVPRRIASADKKVYIIGGGPAGLTAAYRLMQAGIPSEIYEGSGRHGGRMFTHHN